MSIKTIVRTILKSGLFDAEWYSKNNPDCEGLDPRQHYTKYGFRELRDPSPLFSCTHYLDKYADVQAAAVNPVVHYLKIGGREDRQPHPFVSPIWLRDRLTGDFPQDNPLLAYIESKPDFGPRPIFDIALMRSELELPEAASAYDVMAAYALTNFNDQIQINTFWDPGFVRHNLQGITTYRNLFSAWESEAPGRASPHPMFDRDFVWKRYPFTQDGDAELSTLEKLLNFEFWNSVAFSDMFDAKFYASQFSAAETPRQNLTEHYLTVGSLAGIDPNPWFDDKDYRLRYLEGAPKVAALTHYLTNGREPHVRLISGFSSEFYKARHPGIEDAYPGTMLEHYIKFGRKEGRKYSDPIWLDDFVSWDELRGFVRDNAKRFGAAKPDVSIVIPVYNHFSHTLRCVGSLLRANETAKMQIIIADDGSSDETREFFSAIPEITYIRNPENLGFLKSCNNAAKSATAPYIFFLNNDTAVLPGAIDSLLETAKSRPDAGLIGSKLVYPDGTLQEAGGYIWQCGDGANVGRNSDPVEPGYNLLRDADYISGAAILVPRKLWEDLGGFDPHFAPAYCEDSDFAVRLKSLGWRVIYQPDSTVVHFEGISSGTDLGSGTKAYQTINQKKLVEKWDFALQDYSPDQPLDVRNLLRPTRPRVLIIDATVPAPDRDAGSVTSKWYMRLLIDLGYDVTFMAANLRQEGHYTSDLQKIGVEVLHLPYVSNIDKYLDQYARNFDLFFLYRVDIAKRYISKIRILVPGAPIIFNTVDLHFLRAEREAILNGRRPEEMQAALRVRQNELAVMDQANETILLSSLEQEYLKKAGNTNSFSVMPLVLSSQDHVPPRKGRTGVAFVGGFQHTPNVDAVEYFMAEIWPVLREADPDMEVHIVGSNAPESILKISKPGVQVHGFIEDLDGFLDQRIATIVPLQYGAGIKGKIGSSFAAGVPCVSTKIGAEGMGLKDQRELLIADDTEGFVNAILRLKKDTALWNKISKGGRKFVQDNYSPEVMKDRLLRLLAKTSAAPFGGICPISGQKETRRFQGSSANSLASAPDAPFSGERVAAAGFARFCGKAETPICRLKQEDAADLALFGDLSHISQALGGAEQLADPKSAKTAVVQMELNSKALKTIDGIVKKLSANCTNLIIAGSDPTKTPSGLRQRPETLTALVLHLEQKGWQVRCSYLPLKESILTGTVLVEARRAG